MKKYLILLLFSNASYATSYSYLFQFKNNLNEPVKLTCVQLQMDTNKIKQKVNEVTITLNNKEVIEKSFSDSGVYLECTPTIISSDVRLPLLITDMFEKWQG